MLVFIVPIKSAKISRDWKLSSRLFERCLRAICNQTSQNFRVVVVCNEKPETRFTHPNVHYIEVDFPPPVADPAEQRTTGYEYGYSKDIARKNADKARKLHVGLDYAHRYNPTHSMVVDADDCVSRRLAEFVEKNPGETGWYFKRGYMYPEGRRLLYLNRKNFNVICGSSVIIAYSRRNALFSNPDYYCHTFDPPPPAAMLVPLPFIGGVYSMANGDNIYMTAETKGQIHSSLMKRIFSKEILSVGRKILKYRPALVTQSIRREFGLYELGKDRRADRVIHPRPMRLLLVVPNIVTYRVFLRQLCRLLRADGVDVHIACSMDALWGAHANGANDDVSFHPLTIPRGMSPLGHWRAARELDALVTRLSPDIVHAHFSTTIFTAALARRGGWPPTLGTFHGVSFPLVGGVKGRLLRAAESWASGRMDEVWVLTADDRERLHAAAPGARVEVHRSAGIGCNLDKFDPACVSPEEREMLRAKLGLRPGHRVFVFVGRFVGFKGYALTVRTFLQIAASDPQLRLLLVGAVDPLHPTGLTPEEEEARANCPQIIDAGSQTDVAKYLAVSDAMVFPSQREGMPVCLMESLAMGVPAITRDARGCRDVVRDGVDGFVLRDCTVANLAEAIRRIADSPELQRKMSAQALAGRARFDRGHFIREQKEIYAAWASANPQPADELLPAAKAV